MSAFPSYQRDNNGGKRLPFTSLEDERACKPSGPTACSGRVAFLRRRLRSGSSIMKNIPGTKHPCHIRCAGQLSLLEYYARAYHQTAAGGYAPITEAVRDELEDAANRVSDMRTRLQRSEPTAAALLESLQRSQDTSSVARKHPRYELPEKYEVREGIVTGRLQVQNKIPLLRGSPPYPAMIAA
jgi:hypothetical protein